MGLQLQEEFSEKGIFEFNLTLKIDDGDTEFISLCTINNADTDEGDEQSIGGRRRRLNKINKKRKLAEYISGDDISSSGFSISCSYESP